MIFLSLISILSVITSGYAVSRPCPLNDYTCIGNVLATYSKCNPNVKGYVPKSYVIPKFQYSVPLFNRTIYNKRVIVKRMDKCYVTEFMHYEKLKSFVLGVNCPAGYYVDADRHELEVRYMKPTIIRNYNIVLAHPKLTMSIDFNPENQHNVCSSQPVIEIAEPNYVKITKIDNGSDSSEPPIDIEKSATYLHEKYYLCGQKIAAYFVNRKICDYGC